MYISALIGLYPSWSEIAMFSLVGFGVVMAVLSILSIVTAIIGTGFTTTDKAKNAPKASSVQKVKNVSEIANKDHAFVVSAAVAAMMPELENDQAELVAVLSAAATVALGEECKVIAIQPMPDMSYAYQGRQQIYASKNYTPVSSR